MESFEVLKKQKDAILAKERERSRASVSFAESLLREVQGIFEIIANDTTDPKANEHAFMAYSKISEYFAKQNTNANPPEGSGSADC